MKRLLGNPRVVSLSAVLGSLLLFVFLALTRAGAIAGALNSIHDLWNRVGQYLPNSVHSSARGTGGADEPSRPTIKDLPPEDQNPPTVEEKFEENFSKWHKKYFYKKNNKWCAEENDDYPFPSMWYEYAYLPLPFRKVVVEFRESSQPINTNPFTVAVGQGNGKEYMKIYLPEEEAHLIGIEKIADGGQPGQLLREPQKEVLTDPIKPGTDVRLTLEGEKKDDNLVEYELTVDYISAETSRPLHDKFFINVELPHISPETVDIWLGIGTSQGNCIEPLRYEIY